MKELFCLAWNDRQESENKTENLVFCLAWNDRH